MGPKLNANKFIIMGPKLDANKHIATDKITITKSNCSNIVSVRVSLCVFFPL